MITSSRRPLPTCWSRCTSRLVSVLPDRRGRRPRRSSAGSGTRRQGFRARTVDPQVPSREDAAVAEQAVRLDASRGRPCVRTGQAERPRPRSRLRCCWPAPSPMSMLPCPAPMSAVLWSSLDFRLTARRGVRAPTGAPATLPVGDRRRNWPSYQWWRRRSVGCHSCGETIQVGLVADPAAPTAVARGMSDLQARPTAASRGTSLSWSEPLHHRLAGRRYRRGSIAGPRPARGLGPRRRPDRAATPRPRGPAPAGRD